MNRAPYRPASALPPFWLTLFLYLVFALWRATSLSPIVWIGVAFFAIPILGGLVSKSVSAARKGVGWTMAFYVGINLIRASVGIHSGDQGQHFVAAMLTIIVFSLLAGGVAGLVAYLRNQRKPIETKQSFATQGKKR